MTAPHESLPDGIVTRLFDAAMKVRQRAYAPISHYLVGVALISDAGTIHAGCNVESVTFNITTHAEMNAIDTMIASGERGFRAILVVTQGEQPGFPCALCRQKIIEFAPDAIVIAATLDGQMRSTTIKELYPEPFLLSDL